MLKINSKDLVVLSNKVDKMGRTDLPVVVRQTLNNLSFQMKDMEIERNAKKVFDYNRSNIVRNLKWSTKAQGLNISKMKSMSGIRERPGRKIVARGLAVQETGGKLNSRVVPTLKSRSGAEGKKIRKKNYIGGNNVLDARNKRKNKFIAAASVAKRENIMILIRLRSGGAAYAYVSRFNPKRKSNPTIKLRWMYRLNESDKEITQKRQFIRKSYISTMKELNNEFTRQANIRLSKIK